MKKFLLIILYTLKHLFKMLLIIYISWLISIVIIWCLDLLFGIEANLAFICFTIITLIAVSLISIAAINAHTEIKRKRSNK